MIIDIENNWEFHKQKVDQGQKPGLFENKSFVEERQTRLSLYVFCISKYISANTGNMWKKVNDVNFSFGNC